MSKRQVPLLLIVKGAKKPLTTAEESVNSMLRGGKSPTVAKVKDKKWDESEKSVTFLDALLKGDKLTGGRADGMSPKEFDSKELQEGTQHETEHSDDRGIAREIAMDHLAEDSKYYSEMDKSVTFLDSLLKAKGPSDDQKVAAAAEASGGGPVVSSNSSGNPYHDPKTGKFTSGPASGGAGGGDEAMAAAGVEATPSKDEVSQQLEGLRGIQQEREAEAAAAAGPSAEQQLEELRVPEKQPEQPPGPSAEQQLDELRVQPEQPPGPSAEQQLEELRVQPKEPEQQPGPSVDDHLNEIRGMTDDKVAEQAQPEMGPGPDTSKPVHDQFDVSETGSTGQEGGDAFDIGSSSETPYSPPEQAEQPGQMTPEERQQVFDKLQYQQGMEEHSNRPVLAEDQATPATGIESPSAKNPPPQAEPSPPLDVPEVDSEFTGAAVTDLKDVPTPVLYSAQREAQKRGMSESDINADNVKELAQAWRDPQSGSLPSKIRDMEQAEIDNAAQLQADRDAKHQENMKIIMEQNKDAYDMSKPVGGGPLDSRAPMSAGEQATGAETPAAMAAQEPPTGAETPAAKQTELSDQSPFGTKVMDPAERGGSTQVDAGPSTQVMPMEARGGTTQMDEGPPTIQEGAPPTIQEESPAMQGEPGAPEKSPGQQKQQKQPKEKKPLTPGQQFQEQQKNQRKYDRAFKQAVGAGKSPEEAHAIANDLAGGTFGGENAQQMAAGAQLEAQAKTKRKFDKTYKQARLAGMSHEEAHQLANSYAGSEYGDEGPPMAVAPKWADAPDKNKFSNWYSQGSAMGRGGVEGRGGGAAAAGGFASGRVHGLLNHEPNTRRIRQDTEIDPFDPAARERYKLTRS